MQSHAVEMVGKAGVFVGLLAILVLVIASIEHEVGNPILVCVASGFVAYNTWAYRNRKSMYFGIGASAPDAGNAPRTIKLAGMWVICIGFLLEQAYSLTRVMRVFD